MKRWFANSVDLLPRAAPAQTYNAALERARVLQHRDGPEVHPACYTQLLTHGRPVERAIVLLHGYTNCPHEVARLGRVLFDRGANVLIPRFPHHGLRDRLTADVRHLTLDEQVRLTDEAVAIACGLGTDVVVAGLCSGGVLTAWAAQFRGEVTRGVLISPSLMAATVPPCLAPAVMLLLDWMPNRFWWWNRQLKARVRRPAYAYPRFSTHALGEIFRLSRAVMQAANHNPPAVREIAVVTNAADHVINRPLIARLVTAWTAHGATIESYTFPAHLRLPHDLIDLQHAPAQMTVVYPVLIRLIERQP